MPTPESQRSTLAAAAAGASRGAYGRAAAALLLLSAWMGLLFAGFLLRGALHLLLVAAALLFPWRSFAPPAPPAAECPAEAGGPSAVPPAS